MNAVMEKILLTLFLILGLNAFNVTHAQDSLEDSADSIDSREIQCPIQGQVNLRLQGTTKNGQLVGFINNQSIFWMVQMGMIQGYYNNNFMTLRLEDVSNNEYSLTGWVGSYFVQWRTFGGYFNERVDCR